jgi:hypothetical protein
MPENKGKWLKPMNILKTLSIPITELASIVSTLDSNGHVEFHASHYQPSLMRISDSGSEFISGLGYSKGYGIVHGLRLNIVFFSEFDEDEARKRLEMENLDLTVQNLELQIESHSDIKTERRRNFILSIITVAISAIALAASLIALLL